jgi:solute carrier family 25 iron transporter 28/37
VHFVVQTRKLLHANSPGHHPMENAIAGIVASVAGDSVLTPMDTVKQRLQLDQSSRVGIARTISAMLREEGVGAFYASFGTTLLMNIPFSAIQFASYHTVRGVWEKSFMFLSNPCIFFNFFFFDHKAKELFNSSSYAPGSPESLLCHWVSGGLAGAVAAGITNPLDVVRTALQTQGLQGRTSSGTRFTGMRHAMQEILRREGWRGFTRGWIPRVLFHMPGTAICWTVYEYCKDLFALWAE